jgi:Flp pilus assembly protein TadG
MRPGGQTRGTAATEFALIFPIVMLLCAGIVEFGRLFAVYEATNRIAAQFALSWADCSDTPAGYCQTELSTYASSNTLANIAPQLYTANLTLQMFLVSMSGTTPTVQYYSGNSSTLTATQTSAAQGSIPSGGTGVVVTATYAHSLQFFGTVMGPWLNNYLTPSYTVAQRKN